MRSDLLTAALAAAAVATARGQVDPASPCPDARPSDASCCSSNHSAPVMGGVDFVDLATNKAAGAAPDFGEARFSVSLSGYSFHFKSQANADAFDADPWSFAPAWGGF